MDCELGHKESAYFLSEAHSHIDRTGNQWRMEKIHGMALTLLTSSVLTKSDQSLHNKKVPQSYSQLTCSVHLVSLQPRLGCH